MREKQILWRSDLWSFCLAGAAMGLLFILGACVQWAHGQSGQGFGLVCTGLFIFSVVTLGALIDRSEARRREAWFSETPRVIPSQPPSDTD